MLRFKWDPNKNVINKKKHKVSFEEARGVFYDLQGEAMKKVFAGLCGLKKRANNRMEENG